MFTSLTVSHHERVALILDGRFSALLGPGLHLRWTFGKVVETVRYNLTQVVSRVEIAEPMPRELPGSTVVEVGADESLVVLVNGALFTVLGTGTWRVWTEVGKVELHVLNRWAEPGAMAAGERLTGLAVPGTMELEGSEELALVLAREGEALRALPTGRYRVFTGGRWSLIPVPLSLQELELSLQDLLTADGVAVRVRPALSFRVVEPVTWLRQSKRLQLAYTAVQLALREVVSAQTLEALLRERKALSEELEARVRAHLPELGVSLVSVAVKDVVVSGEVKALLNTVTLARKEAEAMAIRRKEEVAQTRQRANTAKLLEANPVLMRLKELETLSELAGKVDQLTVVAAPEGLKALGLLR